MTHSAYYNGHDGLLSELPSSFCDIDSRHRGTTSVPDVTFNFNPPKDHDSLVAEPPFTRLQYLVLDLLPLV